MAAYRPRSAFCASSVWNAVRRSRSIQCAVRAATEIFEEYDIPEAAASAEYLAISSFHNVRTRRDAKTLEHDLVREEVNRYVELCRERQTSRKPIQYLVGDWDFHHITLLVRPPTLIPRPETEELVEHLLRDVNSEGARILDVGCGSGAILLAALAARPLWHGVGIDISEEAIALSAENVEQQGMTERAQIYRCGIEKLVGGERFDAIVSNPPYIPREEMDGLEAEVRDHEDFDALCGGEDGLDVVREIFRWAPYILKSEGSLWVEVDEKHPEMLEEMRFEGLEFVAGFEDMYGKQRFCHMRKK